MGANRGLLARCAPMGVPRSTPHARIVTHKDRDAGRVARRRSGDSYLSESGAASALEMMPMTSRELQAPIFSALKPNEMD